MEFGFYRTSPGRDLGLLESKGGPVDTAMQCVVERICRKGSFAVWSESEGVMDSESGENEECNLAPRGE